MADRAKLTVRGQNIMQPALLETNDAHLIEFRDDFGDLNALMVYGVLGTDMWALVTKEDEDWPAMLVRYGYMTPDRPVADIIKSGL